MTKLSLALNKYDVAMASLIGEIKMGLDKTDPLLGQIQVHKVVHGGFTRQVSEPKIVDTEMKRHSAEAVLHFDVYLKTDVEKFVELIYGMWETLTSLAKQTLFETLGLTTEAVGNSHDLAGRNVWDAQLEVFESMEWHFDENGNHNVQLYMGSEAAKKLNESPPTPEQNQKMEALIKRKREEYYAKKRTRRLS